MRKIFRLFAIFIAVVALVCGWFGYNYFFKANLNPAQKTYIYIPTNASFAQVLDSLNAQKLLKNEAEFVFLANKMKYPSHIKAGKYLLKGGVSTYAFLKKLMNGEQDEVTLTFVKFRKLDELGKAVAKKLEQDSSAFTALLYDNAYLSQFGLDSQTVLGMFVPNSYQMYWTTTPDQFMRRMHKEYKKFWNAERLEKLKNNSLTQNQALSLAAIVEEETNQNDEKQRIAGVYLNRIKLGMPLQADPTVKFALNNFAIKRITTAMTQCESPYNTYLVQGLPPSPICTPSIASVDAVLDAETHNYVYFCASQDFSGHHNFAVTYAEHLVNAQKYQAALNQKGIY